MFIEVHQNNRIVVAQEFDVEGEESLQELTFYHRLIERMQMIQQVINNNITPIIRSNYPYQIYVVCPSKSNGIDFPDELYQTNSNGQNQSEAQLKDRIV